VIAQQLRSNFAAIEQRLRSDYAAVGYRFCTAITQRFRAITQQLFGDYAAITQLLHNIHKAIKLRLRSFYTSTPQ
jgi:hypothetical protein